MIKKNQTETHEDQMKILMDTLPLLICYVDRDLRYRFNNRLYEHWTGMSRDEIKGKTLKEVLGNETYELIRDDIDMALSGLDVSFQREFTFKKAGRRYLHVNFVPHKKGIDDVFVIGIAKKYTNRRIFEDEFVKLLKTYGVNAISSYTVFPFNEMMDKNVITSKMKELGMNTVLITNVVDQERNVYSGSWHGHYSTSYSYSAKPTMYKEDVYHLETKLYDTSTEKLIWTALSETFLIDAIDSDYGEELKLFINVMVKKIKEDNLLK
jgi:PAS domain S-box-containing protein